MLTRIVALAVAVIAVASPAAYAKGPDAATIEGGGQRVRIVMENGNQGELLTDLIHVTGYFGIGNVRVQDFEQPPATPGPGYRVTYSMGGGTDMIQVLHPSTSSGSMIYTPPQRLHGGQIRGGWLHAPVNLTLFLRRYSITVATPTPTPAPPPQGQAAVSAGGGRPLWLVVPVALLSVLLVAGAYLVRRRSNVSA